MNLVNALVIPSNAQGPLLVDLDITQIGESKLVYENGGRCRGIRTAFLVVVVLLTKLVLAVLLTLLTLLVLLVEEGVNTVRWVGIVVIINTLYNGLDLFLRLLTSAFIAFDNQLIGGSWREFY